MLKISPAKDRVMVTGFSSIASSLVRQAVRRELRAILDPLSLHQEPDRVFYTSDGVLDAASWQLRSPFGEDVAALVASSFSVFKALEPALAYNEPGLFYASVAH